MSRKSILAVIAALLFTNLGIANGQDFELVGEANTEEIMLAQDDGDFGGDPVPDEPSEPMPADDEPPSDDPEY